MNAFIKREYDYAIRICAFLAGVSDKKPVALSQISRLLQITRPFASKIVYQLRQKDIVRSTQGKYGGIFLHQDPEQLSVYDILRAMDFDSTINECIQNPTICPLTGVCKIHRFLEEQEQMLVDNMKAKKISELQFTVDDLNFVKEMEKNN